MGIRKNSILILLSCSFLFTNIYSTIISNGYHFFDIFYYRDIYKSLVKQNKSNICSFEDGPNCFYIKGKDKLDISKDLKEIYPDTNEFVKEDFSNVLSNLKQSIQQLTNKESDNLEENLFSFDSPYVLSLYLTFESYDEITKKGDIYAPETIDNQYDVGHLTLTILGKLRLTQKDAEKFSNHIVSGPKDDFPRGCYAFVESKEVIIKFNTKASISHVYIKRNKYNENNKSFYLYGFIDGQKQIIARLVNVPKNYWIKISGDGKKYDSIGLLRGFDYDNFVIYATASKENAPNYDKIAKKYSNELMSQISKAVQEQMNNLKSGNNVKNQKVQVIKINLNQKDLIKDTEPEDDFDIPKELMEDNNNKKDVGEKKPNIKEDINKNDL